MIYIHSWSGGKDSTASIILDHIHGLPPSKIIMSEVMFDKRRGISGELPEHMDWVRGKAIPRFESWGYEVEILHARKDYLDLFWHVVQNSKKPERNGKYAGWLIGGMCAANSRLKTQPIKDYLKSIKDDYIQYNGIAIDEPERLQRLDGTSRVSLLARYGYTEQMAYDLCREYDLLSPIYQFSRRGGCWFCPNQPYRELARTKRKHPELWEELRKLSRTKNLVSQCFKYSETFAEVEARADAVIERQKWEEMQISIFDDGGGR